MPRVSGSRVWVRTFVRDDGTRVEGHWRKNTPGISLTFPTRKTFPLRKTFNTSKLFGKRK